MSTIARQQEARFTRPAGPPAGDSDADWLGRTRVFLQPIAPPSILGLFGFAGATFIVAAHLAGWYGNVKSPTYLFPFAAFFGGVAQFSAAMWAYRARDGLATAMHGMWGAFWMAYGLLFLLVATKTITVPAAGPFPELGYWFLALAVITGLGALAAFAESLGLVATLVTLAVGSAFLAVRYLDGGIGWQHTGGWVLIASAIAATYTAGAMMLENTFGKVILPLGKYKMAANKPGGVVTRPLEHEAGMPGVRQGQ
jgi:succinate-acetate transporter protein